MGVDLYRRGASLSMDWDTWRSCFRIASAFGWSPAGTAPPDDFDEVRRAANPTVKWDGGYFSNDYQRVTDADAKDFAAALFRALRAVRSGEMLTVEQHLALPSAEPGFIEALAWFARTGEFEIG